MIRRNKNIPKDNEAQKLSFHKVRTNIPGFDELLYGGLIYPLHVQSYL